MRKEYVLLGALLNVLVVSKGLAQTHEEPILYGNMENWVVRNIHESAVIGGNNKTLYEIGPSKTIDGNNPYKNMGHSPWGTSNVLAKVMGVVKGSASVFRDTHGSGHSAKMMTHVERVKVLGLLNINVLAAGSIYLGDITEPVSGSKDGERSLNWGIPYTKRPTALRFDYRVHLSGQANRIRQSGGKATPVAGKDKPVALLLLQKRTEDSKGNVTAQRIGTIVIEYDRNSNGWVENATYPIWYGDIRHRPGYNAQSMGLRNVDYVRNSKGKQVLLKETGWADKDETPTHLIIQFSSSNGGAFVGSPGNTFWIDNVSLVF